MKTTQSPIVGLITVFILASASTLLNMILPFKEILKWLQIPGPAGGMMIFGGFVFTFWITLAYLLLQCRSFTGVSVAVLIPAFCMIFSPWYGVVDPPWFGLYGIAAFFVAGLVLELTYRWRRNYNNCPQVKKNRLHLPRNNDSKHKCKTNGVVEEKAENRKNIHTLHEATQTKGLETSFQVSNNWIINTANSKRNRKISDYKKEAMSNSNKVHRVEAKRQVWFNIYGGGAKALQGNGKIEPTWVEIKKIEVLKNNETLYDITTTTENFFANGILVHNCNQNYLCSQIARPPSVRAKLAWLKLARGFAYLRGSTRVELIDLEKSFPLAFWKRMEFMDEHHIPNKLKRLRELFEQLKQEIADAKEAIRICKKLKERFDPDDYRRLEEYANAKGWVIELKDDVDSYFDMIANDLESKFNDAKARRDYNQLLKINQIAKQILPSKYHARFDVNITTTIKLDPKTLAKLATIDRQVFVEARQKFEQGIREMKLTGEIAIKYLKKMGVIKG